MMIAQQSRGRHSIGDHVGKPMADPELLRLSEAVVQDRDRILTARLGTPCGPITLLMTSQKGRQWTFGVAVALFLFGGIAFSVWWDRQWSQAMHGVFAGNTGPVSLRADWPQPLKELLDESRGIKIDESTIQVHCLNGGAYDQEFVWRMDAAPGLFELLESRWKLTPVDGPEWGIFEGYVAPLTHVRAPDWWSPRDDGQTSFYESPYGFEGRGDRFHIAVDGERSTIWVQFRYKF
jgi:hypothetical protein